MVGLVQPHRKAEIDETGDAVLAAAAGHDSGEVLQIRLDVQADAVERHPAAQFRPEGRDLVLADGGSGRLALDPDADAALAPRAVDIEFAERADDPGLQA